MASATEPVAWTPAWGEPPVRLLPLDEAGARMWVTELHQQMRAAGLEPESRELEGQAGLSGLLAAVLSLSSHLRHVATVHPGTLVEVLAEPPLDALARLEAEVVRLGRECESETELMRGLRKAKSRAALLCGLADLGGWWSAEQVTAALTRFADAALNAACDFLLRDLAARGKISIANPSSPQAGSGLIVLGMGKYGAHELNYSSDIDLILFFEEEGVASQTDDPVTLFTRFAKSLIRILQERTGDGYVFRVDLRLRPDPGSTPLAIPVETALNYYEAYGQNWERAAMIKARPVAGDRDAGARFLKELVPFIWRKYLDYAAISDVHSIKRQIHAHRGHGAIAVAGHNIKLGRGGIREIEFFAQTQQLIAGGRLPQLRKLRTLDALGALEEEGWIDARARDALSAAYWYLRSVEHRIQMVADEQSHTLPDDAQGLERIARMMGDPDAGAFSARLTAVLRTVERHYAGLFEKAPELTIPGGNLVFTGDDDDPATVETLSVMGFAKPSEVIRTVRGWHFGRFPAVRTAQARELLTEITPGLLEAIAGSGDADRTLAAFDRFLAGLPAGIQLFSLLKSNHGLLRLLLLILSAAPRLADIITRKPHVFDGLLEPAFAGKAPGRAAQRERLAAALSRTPYYEAALDQARIFAAEQKFLIGVRFINRTIGAEAAGKAFADLAEVLIQAMLERVREEFSARHGTVPGSRMVILGMGRLGSRELTAGSDLDLIFLYDHDEGAEMSDGPKPLPASQYFIRFTQRLIAAMSAPTSEGVIYPLDFRLRPSGNAGPLATHVSSFLKYQREEAWTWERQALTRARIVAGDPELAALVETEVCTLLAPAADPQALKNDVAGMRERIAREKATSNPFEVKTVGGGLLDVEFLAQWAMLRAGACTGGARPAGTRAMISAAPDDLISPADKELLLDAFATFTSVLQLLRLCMDEEFSVQAAPHGLAEMLCLELDLPDIRSVEAHLKNTQSAVRELFLRVLG